MSESVIVVGASDNPQRYSFQAVQMLQQYGHTPIPVTPRVASVAGLATLATVADVGDPVRATHPTVTLYVNATLSTKMQSELIALSPRRVIFNPGAENLELAETLEAAGIETIEGCTLVMLRTGQF